MHHHLRCLCLLLMLLAPIRQAAAVLRVVYPPPVSANDRRSDYPLQLLRLALSKVEQRVELVPYPVAMNKARAVVMLTEGRGVDVAWMTTSPDRERTLLPIRICIYKGLGGWRLPLIRRDRLLEFAAITRLSQLTPYSVGQQADWPDVAILRHNGFSVMTAANYDQLFDMLRLRRFDWFSRNVLEVWDEQARYGRQELVVEPHLLIRYPTAFYFFVNQRNVALARRIEQGLNRAIADGSFDRLFQAHFGKAIRQSRLSQRQTLSLANPDLPATTPLARKELWYR